MHDGDVHGSGRVGEEIREEDIGRHQLGTWQLNFSPTGKPHAANRVGQRVSDGVMSGIKPRCTAKSLVVKPILQDHKHSIQWGGPEWRQVSTRAGPASQQKPTLEKTAVELHQSPATGLHEPPGKVREVSSYTAAETPPKNTRQQVHIGKTFNVLLHIMTSISIKAKKN